VVMKLNASVLVAVAMMVGSLGATGCKSQDKITDTGNNVAAADTSVATPEDNPEAAPVSTEPAGSTGVEKDAVAFRYWAGHAPPAVRIEERGVAPGAGYFYRPGYYGWSGRDYNWYGGRWYPQRVGYEYASPSWHAVGGRWGYRPGRWYRR